MAKKKLSDEQKIRNKIRQNVISKRNFLDKDSNRAIKDQFVEKFVLCEIALKSVLSNYYKTQGKEKEIDNIEMGLSSIKAALKLAHYDIKDENLEKLFKARRKRGERSARDLRNGIIHNLTIPDLQEVTNRKDELFKLLDDFTSLLISDSKW